MKLNIKELLIPENLNKQSKEELINIIRTMQELVELQVPYQALRYDWLKKLEDKQRSYGSDAGMIFRKPLSMFPPDTYFFPGKPDETWMIGSMKGLCELIMTDEQIPLIIERLDELMDVLDNKVVFFAGIPIIHKNELEEFKSSIELYNIKRVE